MRRPPETDIRHLVIYAMFAAMMFVSKQLMEALPNIHLVGMFVTLLTVCYRKYALIPIYIFVLLEGVIAGFGMWWVPYLYIWTLLWAAVMVIPKNIPDKAKAVIYPAVCGLHGLLFGILYAPAQAILFHLSFKGMLAWILAGLPYDLIHCAGNTVAGLLILPLSRLVGRFEKHS